MNGNRSSKMLASFCFFCYILSFLPHLLIAAEPKIVPEESGQEASVSQAQATMASLFGRGAKMPGIPRINGTIALPSFDSSGMKIDEAVLLEAQRQRPEAKSSETRD